MSRVEREPLDRGSIVIRSAWGLLAHIDCREGGAQRLLTDLCWRFERAGWTLDRREHDWQFLHRASLRWEIRIETPGSGQTHRSSWGAR